MDAIEAVKHELENYGDHPLYLDTRPLMAALIAFALYTIVQELPAIQRYLNLRSMARDHKPTR